jgi:hypothetical protein
MPSCVIQKAVIDRQVSSTATNDSTLYAISDEAFVLRLLLENSSDHWVGIYHSRRVRLPPSEDKNVMNLNRTFQPSTQTRGNCI